MNRNDANDGVSINKTGGQVNKDNDGNLYADFIVAIHSKGVNTNVVFSDTMGSYMTLNGDVSFFSDEACSTPVQPQPVSTTVANSTFAYTISKMEDNETIYAKYRVYVDKKFTYNDDWVAKTNKASVKSEEHNSEKSNEIQLQISNDLKYPTISKEGIKESDGVINWTIKFGKAGYDISGLKLKDVLKTETNDNYLASQFKEGSFTVNPAVDGLTFDSLKSENGFTMPEGSNGEYTITYQTTYTQPTDATKNYKVSNTVSEYPDGELEYSKDNANVEVAKKYNYVQKDFISFDEQSREAIWKVTVHVPETGIADLKVEDEIPKGMEFVNGSLSDLSEGVKTPTISEDKEKNKVYFSFGNVTKGTISFTYKTKITTEPENNTTYNNKVRVYEKDKKLGTDEAKYELTFKQYLSKDTDWNTFKVEGNDVSTSIPWVLTVSKLPADAKNVVITDTLPSNLKMVENSLMIKENRNNNIDSSNINVEIIKTSTGNVINFELSDSLIELAKRQDIQILFNTTYEDLSKVPSGSIEYKNTAQIKVDDYTAPAVSASRWREYKSKDILNKDGVYNDGEIFIHYTISVNKSSADLNPNGDTLTLEDTIGSEIDFQLGTLKINGVPATANQYSYDDATRKITITIPDNQYTKITYDGYPNIAIGEEFTSDSNNEVVLRGVDHVNPADKSFDKIKVHQSSGTSTSNGVSLTVYKQEKGVSAKALKGAKFALYEVTVEDGKETDATLVSEKTTVESGYVSFSGLSRSKLYKLVETQAPDGYVLDSTPNYLMFKDATRAAGLITKIKVGEKEYNVNLIDSKVYNKQIIVEDELITKAGSLKLTKHFAGLDNNQINDALKQSISFDVQKKDSSNVTHINLNDPGWETSNGTYSYTLTNLPIGEYTVTETHTALNNYTVSTVYTYSVDGKESKQVSAQGAIPIEDGKVTNVNITNTYEKLTTSYSVQKVWSDSENQLQVRPDSVTVQLYADNSPVDVQTVVLSNDNNWKYEWTGLDKFNAAGNEITYSAQEVDVNPNYSVSYENNVITNTLKTTSYQVEKVWNDNNNAAKKRPSEITVQLLRQAEGSDAVETVDSVVLNEKNEWKHTFDKLLLANKEGKAYTYRVIESKVDSYASDVVLIDKTFVITNTYQEQSRNIAISKTDVNNIEIAGASLKLSRINGDSKEEIASWTSGQDGKAHVVTINPGTYYLEEISAPEHFKIAEPITFEVAVDGTVSIITKNDQNETVNTPCENNVVQMVDQNIEQTSYSVQKVWNDNDNAGNKRPSKITVKLQRKLSTEETFSNVGDVVTLNNKNEWKNTWNALDATDQFGNSYTYQAVEVGSVKGYISSSSNENNKTTITNIITSVKVSKIDITSSQELEGAHIQILDGNKVVEEWDSTSETHVVYGLETNKLYTLHETIAPGGYTLASDIPFKLNEDGNVVVTDLNKDSISNDGRILLKDALTLIRILKVDAVTNTPLSGAHIQILDGNKVVQEFDSTEDNAGIQIDGLKTGVVYTLHESSAPNNYTLAADTHFSLNADGTINLEKTNTDFEIKNGSIVLSVKDVQIPKTTYSVQKEWVDNNNALNNRPSTIQVQLQSKLGNGEFTNYGEAITLNKDQDNNWTYTWNDLPSTNAEGTKYTYQAVELEKSENYLAPSYRYDASTKKQIITNKSYPVVEISKTNVLGDEIQGAVLTLIDTNGNEVSRWISGSETNADGTIKTHFVQVAPGIYTLQETAIPDNNYVLAQDITFKVDEEGKVLINGEEADKVVMVDTFAPHDVVISKTDLNGKELKGAKLEVTGIEEGGTEIEKISWVSDGNTKNISVKPGTYTLQETATPDNNYVLAQDITFKVDSEGKVTVDGKPVERVTMIDDYSDHSVEISKTDVGGKELAGAQLSVVDANGTMIDSWTSSTKTHKVTVKPGTYTLHETATPDNNYVKAQDITFTVNENGVVTMNNAVVDHITMVDEYNTHPINISKVDIGGNEIAGASMKITGTPTGSSSEITPIEWVSGSDGNNEDGTLKNHAVSLQPGSYTLEETEVPDGNVYVKAANINFTVNVDGTVKVADNEASDTVTMVDYYSDHGIVISKQDVNGAAVKGALLKLFDKENNEVASWETDGITDHQVEVQPGTYTLREEATPDNNYVLAQDITFTVDEEGKVLINGKEYDKVVMVDTFAPHDVVISKTDLNGKELKGAKLEVTGIEEGGAEIEKISWVSDGNTKNISVKPGTYTLHEESTPDNNYVLAQDITFKVDSEGKVTVDGKPVERVTMVDEYNTHPINISKVDIGGNEIAGASMKITGTPTGSESEITPIEWVSGSDGNNEDGTLKNHVVSLQPGTYTLHEEATPDNNYVLAQDITFTVDKEGKVLINGKEYDKVVMIDTFAPHDVVISKTDLNGKELKGAKLEVTGVEEGGTEIEKISWVSDGNTKNISVKPGTYTLHEEATPDNNYVLAQDITFKVDREGKVTVDDKTVERVTMVDDYSDHSVEISKTDAGGKELAGAQLSVVDANGTTIDSWTSSTKTHKVTVKPGTYTLHEESTPDNNYVLAQDITFTVNENGVVTMNDAVVDHVTMVDEYNTHPINISKVDIGDNEIAGASMKITGTPTGSSSEITPIEWVSGSDGNNEDGTVKNHAVSLQPGNYTLEETAVPDGNVYVKAAKINFTVNVDGTVKVADSEAGDTVTMVDYYSDHGIVISKQDVNGAAVKGALLKLFDKENNEVASWETDGMTDHQVEVQPGTYTLHEEATPDNNYVKAQDITFTVDEEGKVLINGEEADKVVMVDTFAPHDVVISKTDLNGKELKGAKLEVTGIEEGGTEIEKISWVSDGNTKNISVKPGTYTLHEKATPDNNFVLAQDITFKVDSEGKITVDGKPVERVTMIDDYSDHFVEISKTDVGGNELAGAQLAVVDANGTMIDSWTSSTKTHKVTVKPGTYTLHEDLSPVGYKVAKDITFDVDIEGKVTVNGKKVDQVIMVDEDQTYDIAISKQDITNNKELPGAKLALKDTKTNKVVETWTSASEAHVVTVVPSTYELSEVAAPNGYEIAEKITFTVERDGTITIDGKKVETVIMQDQPTKPTVDTSDHNNIVFYGFAGVISLGMALMMLLTRKKIH